MKNLNAKLKEWMVKATFPEQHRLAKLCATSRVYLHQIATGWRSTSVSTELAIKIEKASRELNKENPDLPIVLQYEICKTCAKCPYANACKK